MRPSRRPGRPRREPDARLDRCDRDHPRSRVPDRVPLHWITPAGAGVPPVPALTERAMLPILICSALLTLAQPRPAPLAGPNVPAEQARPTLVSYDMAGRLRRLDA